MKDTLRRVTFIEHERDLNRAIQCALKGCGILDRISRGSRVVLKPNLTLPRYQEGVTTSPEIIRATIGILKDNGAQVAVAEGDGGYGAWTAEEAFAGHGLTEMAHDLDVELLVLRDLPCEPVRFQSGGRDFEIPLPVRLIRETDLMISMPVPKIHALTGLSLALKNQWGCIPDRMRLRFHHVFEDGILAINRALHPVVLGDGTFVLDRNGPIAGNAIRMDWVIASTDPGTFDRYVSELMGWSWKQIPHLARAAALGQMPISLDEIECNVRPMDVRKRTFRLRRTLRNWIALAGFHSRFLTWLGYESWLGREVIHRALYAVAERTVPPRDKR